MIETPCRLKPSPLPSTIDQLYTGPQPISITLLEMIHGGARRWSQVYRVEINEWKGRLPETQAPTSFVLKLYVPSELDSLEDWDPYESNHLGSDPQESQHRMAKQENKAYQSLIGCTLTPRWYGSYEFTLPSNEKCIGMVLDYLAGKTLSYAYIFDHEGCKLPFEERALSAAEALEHVHSYGVTHGDIREANIIMVQNLQGHFDIRFIDFGYGDVWYGKTASDEARECSRLDSRNLLRLLLEYFGFSRREAIPLLRAMPRQGAILKFLEVLDIQPTLEAQIEFEVARVMEHKAFPTEEEAWEFMRKHTV